MSADVQTAEKEEYMTEEPENLEPAQSGQTTALTAVPNQEISTTTPATPTTTSPPILTDDQINAVVAHINELANQTIYVGHAQIGAYVLETFFNNDQNLAQSHNPFKDAPSYRTLCEREDLLVSPATLNRSVRVAIQERFFQAQGLHQEQGFQNLTFTHKAELIRIPPMPRKVEFVRVLIGNLCTTRELPAKVDAILNEITQTSTQTTTPTRSQDASKLIIRKITSLETWANNHEFNEQQFNADVIRNMNNDKKQALKERIQTLETRLEPITRLITTIKAALDEQTAAQQPGEGQGTDQS